MSALDKLPACAQPTSGACTAGGTGALSIVRDSQNGSIKSITLGQITENYSYNSFGELRSKTAFFGTTPLTQFTYAHPRDTLGRITRKVESLNGGTSTAYDYTYDTKGRLTNVSSSGTTVEHYGYGPQNDNRTSSLTISSTNVSYDAQDRLTNYGDSAYTYTKDGQLSTKTDASGTTTYIYDTAGNLVSVARPGGAPLIEYITDGKNRRVAKKVGGHRGEAMALS